MIWQIVYQVPDEKGQKHLIVEANTDEIGMVEKLVKTHIAGKTKTLPGMDMSNVPINITIMKIAQRPDWEIVSFIPGETKLKEPKYKSPADTEV